MNEDRIQILEMLQTGKISVDEATQLLEAADRPRVVDPPPASNRPTRMLEEDEDHAQTGRSSAVKLPNMVGTYLEGAKLAGTRLEGADLTGAYLGNADLRGADLRDAELTGTYLEGANLRNANLRGANLTGAYLEKADFENADLAGVNLTGTHIPRAKVRNGSFVFGEDDGGETTAEDNRMVNGDVVVAH